MPFDLNSNPVRIAIGAALLVLGLIIGWFGHKTVSAPPDIPIASQYDDWRLTCPKGSEKDLSCEMQLDVPDAKGQTELARLQIYKPKNGTTNEMLVTVPFNVLLDPGIGIVFGSEKPRLYPYEYCGGLGCVVRVKYDADVEKAMVAAGDAKILLAGLDGKAAALPFSLKGFVAAHKAFVSDAAKRHSWWWRFWS
jgi:invasion protein IalB